MKKEYVKPEVEAIDVKTTNIVATSDPTIGNGTADEEDVLGREDNTPSRPNIWEQGW